MATKGYQGHTDAVDVGEPVRPHHWGDPDVDVHLVESVRPPTEAEPLEMRTQWGVQFDCHGGHVMGGGDYYTEELARSVARLHTANEKTARAARGRVVRRTITYGPWVEAE